MEVSLKAVMKILSDPKLEPVAVLLLRGATKAELHECLSGILGAPTDSAVVDIARMNAVGSLRSWGYIVSGGRGGGNVYQVTGWAEKPVKPTVDTWTGEAREIYDWVLGLEPVEDFHYPRVIEYLRKREEALHENCWLYLRAYEMVDYGAWWYETQYVSAIIIRKFVNYPRFKIFNLHSEFDHLHTLVKTVAKASTARVNVINVQHEWLRDIWTKSNSATLGYVYPRVEAIYDTTDIGENPAKYLNRRALEGLKARSKDTEFYEVNPDNPAAVQDAIETIDRWRDLNEQKHRQLAIRRDYIAATAKYPDKIMFEGVRDHAAVIHHLFDTIPAHPEIATLMNEKALNYRQYPDGRACVGGHPGLSDYNQVMTCRLLAAKGIKYINSGGVDGGGWGLGSKKMKYACSTTKSYTWQSFDPFKEA